MNPLLVPSASEQRASELLHTLYIVNDMLKQVEADGLNIDLILRRVLSVAIEQLNARDGSIIVLNQNLDIEHARLTNDNPKQPVVTALLESIMAHGLAGWVARTNQPGIVLDTLTDPRWFARPDHPTSVQSWSIISTPCIVRNRAIGVISIHKPGQNQFLERDLDLLTLIANQAATTIENARLYEQSQRQLRTTALLNEASRVINSSLNTGEIMRLLLAQMNELLNAEALSIALVDKQSNELVYQVAEGIGSDKIRGLRLPSNQGLSGWVMENKEPALVSDTGKDIRFYARGDQLTGHRTRAMICAPMVFKGETLGTIQAINPIQGTFTKQDLDLLVNLANIASSALGNAGQFARTQAAEVRYLSLFQDSIDPIILTDSNNKIVEANRRACEFLGYEREELLNMPIEQLYPTAIKVPRFARMKPDEVRVFKSQVFTKEDQILHVEVYTKRISFENNELLQWILHDISKQIELEEMRQDLTAMLFHDLQSPLGNVISSLELLGYELVSNSNPTLAAMLDIAIRSSHRLQTLVRSLLDINRLEAGHPISEQSPISMDQLVDEVYEIERPNFEKLEIEFIRRIDPNLPYVYVEEDMVRRVLVNLLDNALKYSSESHHITLVADKMLHEDKVLVSVMDQGTGIPKKYRKTIFEKFQRVKTTDAYSKGLGLGLAFCRLAVEAHGGTIWVEDAPGGGARFNFTLPIVAEHLPVSVY